MLLPVSGFSHSETSLLFISRKGVIGRFISAVHTALHVQYLRMLPQCQEFPSLLCHCCMLWLLTHSLARSLIQQPNHQPPHRCILGGIWYRYLNDHWGVTASKAEMKHTVWLQGQRASAKVRAAHNQWSTIDEIQVKEFRFALLVPY